MPVNLALQELIPVIVTVSNVASYKGDDDYVLILFFDSAKYLQEETSDERQRSSPGERRGTSDERRATTGGTIYLNFPRYTKMQNKDDLFTEPT